MKKVKVIRALLGLMGLYDGILGIAFLFAGPWLFSQFQVTPPNHWGYVHFSAALLIVFAIMFLALARRPASNRNLIPYCILLKASYCGVVFYHWLLGAGLPDIWKPFAFVDLVMAIILAWIWTQAQSAPGGARGRM